MIVGDSVLLASPTRLINRYQPPSSNLSLKQLIPSYEQATVSRSRSPDLTRYFGRPDFLGAKSPKLDLTKTQASFNLRVFASSSFLTYQAVQVGRRDVSFVEDLLDRLLIDAAILGKRFEDDVAILLGYHGFYARF